MVSVSVYECECAELYIALVYYLGFDYLPLFVLCFVNWWQEQYSAVVSVEICEVLRNLRHNIYTAGASSGGSGMEGGSRGTVRCSVISFSLVNTITLPHTDATRQFC